MNPNPESIRRTLRLLQEKEARLLLQLQGVRDSIKNCEQSIAHHAGKRTSA